MSDTSELLKIFMTPGMVGEAPRHLELVPPLEPTNVTEAQSPLSPTQSIGSSALSELVPELIEPDPAPAKGIRKPGKTTVGSAPEDEHGQRIFAITDKNPDIANEMELGDFREHIGRVIARHEVNENRFFANTLPAGTLESVDARRAEYEQEIRFAPTPEDLLPNPTVPPIIDAASVKRTVTEAVRRYKEKPLLKDKQ